jgi:hypothetical protein
MLRANTGHGIGLSCVSTKMPMRERRAFAGDIGLGDHQPVGEDRLLACLRRPGQRIEACLGVDHRYHQFQMEHLAERAVGGECLQDRRGVGQAGRLDHDAFEVGQFAALALHHHAA